jgi:hypothetical protein
VNHIGDTNKMVSDTPRMDASAYDDGAIWETGCDIERELNAANERINQLEENLMDVKNKHAALVADVALYEDRGERIKRLEDALKETVSWIVDLANSGDAGFLDADIMPEVIQARAALKAKEAKL